MKPKILFALAFAFVLELSSSSAGEITNWEPVQDRNMVVTVRTIDKDGVHEIQYKYHMRSSPVRVPPCDEVQRFPELNEIWLTTQEAKPIMYIISNTYNAYKPEGQDNWIGVDPSGQDIK